MRRHRFLMKPDLFCIDAPYQFVSMTRKNKGVRIPMNKTTKPAAKALWQKPVVKSVTPVKRTSGGPIIGSAEDIFYSPS